MPANHQKTLDDIERVLPKRHRDDVFKPVGPKNVKPRCRAALELYDRIQNKNLEEDPLFS